MDGSFSFSHRFRRLSQILLFISIFICLFSSFDVPKQLAHCLGKDGKGTRKPDRLVWHHCRNNESVGQFVHLVLCCLRGRKSEGHCELRHEYQAEAKVVVAVDRSEAVAKRRATAARIVAPATATKHSARTTAWTCWIGLRTAAIVARPI